MSGGGPQRGSGRPLVAYREERGWTRCRPVKAMFRPPEHDDLQAIAAAWGVPVATALWAIVVGELARYRRQAPELGDHGLAIAAASRVLRQKVDRDCAGHASTRLEEAT